MFCIQCGRPLDEGARYCAACGAPVETPSERRMPPVPGTPPAVPPTVGVYPVPAWAQSAAMPQSAMPAPGPAAGGGFAPGVPGLAPGPRYSGFWRRFWALFIDRLALLVVLFPVSLIFGFNVLWPFWHNGGEMTPERFTSILFGSLSMWMIRTFAEWVYFSSFQSSPLQSTPGQMLLGIRVVGLDGGRIGFARASGRYFASWLSCLVLMIGFLMALFTERKQTLHDMIASTLVVRRSGEPA